jgi:hypothetical protein
MFWKLLVGVCKLQIFSHFSEMAYNESRNVHCKPKTPVVLTYTKCKEGPQEAPVPVTLPHTSLQLPYIFVTLPYTTLTL